MSLLLLVISLPMLEKSFGPRSEIPFPAWGNVLLKVSFHEGHEDFSAMEIVKKHCGWQENVPVPTAHLKSFWNAISRQEEKQSIVTV